MKEQIPEPFRDKKDRSSESLREESSITFGSVISNLKDAEHSVSGKACEYLAGLGQNIKSALGFINCRKRLVTASLEVALVSSLAQACAPRTVSAEDIITATTAITESYTPTPTEEFTMPTVTNMSAAEFVTKATDIPTATRTAEPTTKPTETQTATPENTAAPEIKQFKICSPEEFYNCPVTEKDLKDGSYLNWLKTLSKPFGVSKTVPLQSFAARIVVYNTKTLPNFKNLDGVDFRRDVTSAMLTRTEPDGYTHDYAVMPIEYGVNDDPKQNEWVISLHAYYYPGHNFTREEQLKTLKAWRNKMKFTPLLMSDRIMGTDLKDPLVAETFENFPDMKERFERFIAGDYSSLSEPGILVLNHIADMELYR